MRTQPRTSALGKDLLERLTPALQGGNLANALATVRESWTVPQLIALLTHEQPDIRKVAALALGLMGDQSSITALAVALHDGDPMVTQMAEHALWSIWFRSGRCRAVTLLKQGCCHLNHENYDSAIEKFSQAIAIDSAFAEAWHQRSIANYLAERYPESIADARSTLDRLPQHFGAMAGMGHCHAHLRQWPEARHCYRLALAIHPRIEGIQAALEQVEAILRDFPECH